MGLKEDTELFTALGFTWDRSLLPTSWPTHTTERVCARFRQLLAEFVWDAAFLEGNPFTYVEVKTLLEGVTIGGHKLSDQDQVLNLAQSSKQLLALVKSNTFILNKETFLELHSLVTRKRTPPTGAPELNRIFQQGVDALNNHVPLAWERAFAFFLFGALQQFFFDGNKRTSRMMMNGILMSNALDAMSVPAKKAQEFNQNMVDFYLTKNANVMMQFLVDLRLN